ncbi:hypothetical protein HAX54_007289 [Datura stramonium]|uniref:Uncharacterized protein n=1 Tax=Datura stramonium TaxID=4076 RepID=A0ABS8TBI5_DATST|nr:hypothetical protein [Datura stramonium]
MVDLASGQSPTVVVGQITSLPIKQAITVKEFIPNLSFTNAVKKQSCLPRKPMNLPTIQFKCVTLLHGEPYLKISEAEVEAMDIIQNLQHAVVEIFSYDWPDLEELRAIILTQCSIRGDC